MAARLVRSEVRRAAGLAKRCGCGVVKRQVATVAGVGGPAGLAKQDAASQRYGVSAWIEHVFGLGCCPHRAGCPQADRRWRKLSGRAPNVGTDPYNARADRADSTR